MTGALDKALPSKILLPNPKDKVKWRKVTLMTCFYLSLSCFFVRCYTDNSYLLKPTGSLNESLLAT